MLHFQNPVSECNEEQEEKGRKEEETFYILIKLLLKGQSIDNFNWLTAANIF